MEPTNKHGAVGVKARGGTADGIGIGQSPGNDLHLLITNTTAGDLEVVLCSIHGVMSTVQEQAFDRLLRLKSEVNIA
jgi:hypothetical protein